MSAMVLLRGRSWALIHGWALAAGLIAAALVPEYASAQRPLGIDVSHWQGTINWTSVRNSGKDFAFIKASEGTNFTDSRFVSNITAATAAGMFAAPYHFARPEYGNSATAEANWFMNVAGAYMTTGYLPPVLDLETGAGLGKTALSNWVNEFCNRIFTVKQIRPLVYTSGNYATNYLNSSVNVWPLWIATWPYNPDPQTGNPATGVWPTWVFWQYTDSGSVPGISGNCDLDVFKGTYAELAALAGGGFPQISLSPGSLSATSMAGRSPANQSFTITNSGGGTLNYTITSDEVWLLVSPATGTSSGEADTITVSYDSAALNIGTHNATVTVTASPASNSPQTIGITLVVTPVPGDMDKDGDIDSNDLAAFMLCMTGPSQFQSDPLCTEVDYDSDQDVDQADFGVMQRCMSGSAVRPNPSCLEPAS